MISALRPIAVLLAALPLLAAPGIVSGQSNTRILKYNEKGEVTGVIEHKGEPAAPRGTVRKPKGSVDTQVYRGDDDGDQPGAEPGELLVLDPPSGFEQAMRADGYTVLERISLQSLGLTVLRLRTPPGIGTDAALQAVQARYPSLVIALNERFEVNSRHEGDYGRAVVGWGEVSSSCGTGIRIGMIDTLVDISHPALRGQHVARRSFIPKGTEPGVSDHGTAVAALLVGKPESGDWKGLLPGASLYAANIFAARADGGLTANLASMMRALDWMAEKEVLVVNFSLAGSSNRILTKLMHRASERGLALVAAAGNGGAQAKPAYPAADPAVLAVTAVDANLLPYDYANHGDYIDFAAPGVALWTARKSGGGLQSGTSFAAPFITAAVAIHLSSGVEPDSRILREKLRRFTKDLGKPGRDPVFGWGLVRIRPNC